MKAVVAPIGITRDAINLQCLGCGIFVSRYSSHDCQGRRCKIIGCLNKALPRGKCYVHSRIISSKTVNASVPPKASQ